MKKLVLAYSGGLDTSYCAKYLSKEKGYEVHAVSVNTGGFSDTEITSIKSKALELGATSYTSIDAVQTFYDKVVKYLIFGNVLKNNTYPLSVSAERIVQAIEIVNHAKMVGAAYIAHGSTGAGNDQVRFDMIFQIIAPEIKIITPIRDNKLSREVEIEYLKENGVDYPWEKDGIIGEPAGPRGFGPTIVPLCQHYYASHFPITAEYMDNLIKNKSY